MDHLDLLPDTINAGDSADAQMPSPPQKNINKSRNKHKKAASYLSSLHMIIFYKTGRAGHSEEFPVCLTLSA